MRKSLKILLLAVMLLVMVGMTMLVASAADEYTEGEHFFQVVTVDGETETSHGYFATFTDAVAALKANGANTIKLMADATLDAAITIDTPMTINGQGFTLTLSEAVTGTADDAATEDVDEEVYADAITVTAAGDVTFNNITVAVMSTVLTNGIVLNSAGTLTLYDTTLTGSTYSLVTMATGAKIVIDGENSAIGYGNSAHTWFSKAVSTLEIKAGKIDNTDGAKKDLFYIISEGAGSSFVMSGGQVKSSGDALYSANTLHITVTGGEISSVGSAVNPNGAGAVIYLENCTINAGTGIFTARGEGTVFTAKNVTATGGAIYVKAGATLNVEGGSITGSGVFTVEVATGAANYKDVALTATRLSSAGEMTITNCTLHVLDGNYGVEALAGGYVEIDGLTETQETPTYAIVIRADGEMLIKNASLLGQIYQRGKLTIENGTFDHTAATVQFNTAAGTETLIKGGTFTSANLLVDVTGAGTVFTVTGGTFETTFATAETFKIRNGGRAVLTGGSFTFPWTQNNNGILVDATAASGTDGDGNTIYALTIGGTASIVSDRYGVIIKAGASVKIEGGSISGSNYIYGNLWVTDGVFTNTSTVSFPLIDSKEAAQIVIDGGTWTAVKDQFLINQNAGSGNHIIVNGGTFTAPKDTATSLVYFSNTSSKMTINGGYWSIDTTATVNSKTSTSSTTYPVYLFDKNNGQLSFNWKTDKDGNILTDENGKKIGPTLVASGAAGVLEIGETTAASYTHINGGYFTSTSESTAVNVILLTRGASCTTAMNITDGVFTAEGGTINLTSFSLNGASVVLNISGGEFYVKNNRYGVRLYGSGTYNITDGFFSYVEREYIYNADGTMKDDSVDNSNGFDSSVNGIFFMNCSGTLNFTGGVVYGGPSNKALRLNRIDNFNIDGDVEFYGRRIFDVTMSSGRVGINIYGGIFRPALGRVNVNVVTTQGTPNASYIPTSFVNVYGGDFGSYAGTVPVFDILHAYSVTFGGTYTKGGQEYTTTNEDIVFRTAGSGDLLVMGDNGGTVTVNSGIFTTKDVAFSASAGTINFNGGVVRSAANNTPISITGSTNVTFEDGFFYTYLDNITSPTEIDLNAIECPSRIGSGETGTQLQRTQGIVLNTSGTVTINGGVFHGGNATGAFQVYSNLTVNGGTFYGYRALYVRGAVNVTVQDGTFYPTVGWSDAGALIDIAVEGATVVINGGTFDMTAVKTNVLHDDQGIIRVQQATTLDINGGVYKASVASGATTAAFIHVYADIAPTVTVDNATVDMEGGYFFYQNAGTITIGSGDFTYSAGAKIASSTAVMTITAPAVAGEFAVTFTLEQGGVLPTADEEIESFENAMFVIKSWDSYEVSSAMTLTDFKTFYASYISAFLDENYWYILPGTNCTVEIEDWVPVTVVEGGDLTINLSEAVEISKTLVTILEGGKVTVVNADVTNTYFSAANEYVGMFEVEGGTLYIQNGKFTVAHGSFIHATGASTITVDNAEVTMSVVGTAVVGPVFRFDGNDNTSTLTVNDGIYYSQRFVTIYAVNTDDEGNATAGVTANINGGRFTSIATAESEEYPDGSCKYHFHIARAGLHTINMGKDVAFIGNAFCTIFMANASADGATFTITGGTYKDAASWIYTNKTNITITVDGAVFEDTTDTMEGRDKAAIVLGSGAANVSLTLKNARFTTKSPAIYFIYVYQTVTGTKLDIENTKIVAAQLFRASEAEIEATVTDGLFIILGEDATIFDHGATVTSAVVVANACTVLDGVVLNDYSAQVKYGTDFYRAWVKNVATDSVISATQAAGAEIEISSEFIDLTVDKAGIRFISTISLDVAAEIKEAWEGYTFTAGTLIAPADYVAAAGKFTMDALDKLGKDIAYVEIDAVDTIVDDDYDGIPEAFSGALVSINNYERAYAGVAYIKVMDGDEVVHIYYGAYDSTANARSAKQVAQAIIDDLSHDYHAGVLSDGQVAAIKAFAGITE